MSTPSKFPLAGVLRVRRVQQQAAAAAAAAQARHATMSTEKARARAEEARTVLTTGVTSSVTFRATMVAARSLAADAVASREVAAQARAAAVAAEGERAAATTRVKGMERLEERHRADVIREQDRAEAAATDDLVSGRHAVARSKTAREEGSR